MLFDRLEWNKLQRVLSYLCHSETDNILFIRLHFKPCTIALANVFWWFQLYTHLSVYFALSDCKCIMPLSLRRGIFWPTWKFRPASLVQKSSRCHSAVKVWAKQNRFNNENIDWTHICLTVTVSIIHPKLAFVHWASRIHKNNCVQLINLCKNSLGLLRTLTALKVPRE